jgi:hypothetical protein
MSHGDLPGANAGRRQRQAGSNSDGSSSPGDDRPMRIGKGDLAKALLLVVTQIINN